VPGVVTISASFGAGGSIVGPQVADRLRLPFYDRALPAAVAQRLDVPVQEAVAFDEKAPSGWDRVAQFFARAAVPVGADVPVSEGVLDPDAFRAETEKVLHHIADTTGGVVLGRAAMVVLGGRPDTLCVRLDGPVEQRIAQACAREQLSEPEARRLQRDLDAARDAYLKVFYRRNATDIRLYHLVIDATALPVESCVDLIVAAARARFARAGAVPAGSQPLEGQP